jgi:hypothetical protein
MCWCWVTFAYNAKARRREIEEGRQKLGDGSQQIGRSFQPAIFDLLSVHYDYDFCGVCRADFANKIGNVQKEAAEVQYWIELLIDSGIANNSSARDLHKEPSELLAIFTSIGRKLKQ